MCRRTIRTATPPQASMTRGISRPCPRSPRRPVTPRKDFTTLTRWGSFKLAAGWPPSWLLTLEVGGGMCVPAGKKAPVAHTHGLQA